MLPCPPLTGPEAINVNRITTVASKAEAISGYSAWAITVDASV